MKVLHTSQIKIPFTLYRFLRVLIFFSILKENDKKANPIEKYENATEMIQCKRS